MSAFLVSPVFAIYHFVLGWKTYTKYLVNILKPTNSPQPKANPTQEKNRFKRGMWATSSHNKKKKKRGLGLVLYRKQTDYKKPIPTRFSANTVMYTPGTCVYMYKYGFLFREALFCERDPGVDGCVRLFFFFLLSGSCNS